MSQGPGYVPLSDHSNKGQAKTDIWDCEGAYCDHSALFRHRGGAAGGTLWSRTESLWTRQTEGVLSGSVFPATCIICWLLLRAFVFSNLQVFLKDNASLMKDSNVTMEIPIHTTIAFSITELEIRQDGCFGENFKTSVYFRQELFAPFDGLYRPQSCAWCQTLREGLKWTAPLRQKRWVSREQQITTSDKVKCCLVLSCPDVCSRGSDSHNVTHLLMYFSLLVELEVLGKHFNSLSALPISTRSSLLQQLTKVLEERGAVSTLQSVVRGAKRSHMCWWQQ